MKLSHAQGNPYHGILGTAEQGRVDFDVMGQERAADADTAGHLVAPLPRVERVDPRLRTAQHGPQR